MRQCYLSAAASVLLLLAARPAQSQVASWRPFRPGLVYHFQNSAADSLYTLRLDSAYVAGSDSVFTFNRVMRRSNRSSYFIKSRNNQFGARLVVRPAGEFVLQVQAEAGAGNQVAPLAGESLSLRPRAAVGSSWAASGTVTATLTARTMRPLAGTTDSVATITLSDGRVLELSRRYGLVTAPRLLAGSGNGRQLRLHRLPQFLPEYTAPASIYDFQPGDEFGYTDRNQMNATTACTSYRTLTRILTRQQTADSLIYTQISQSVRVEKEFVYCGGVPIITYYGSFQRRLAYALHPTTTQGVDASHLLTYGYSSTSPGASSQLMLVPATGITNCGITRYSSVALLMLGPSQGCFTPLSDYPEAAQLVTGLGSVRSGSRTLTYYYKQTPGGTSESCGPRQEYDQFQLLPTRAALAAAVATLHPNPAHGQTTLTLATPAPAGTVLTLRDALGRQLWQQPVATGQSATTVPLAGHPAGLYLVQLTRPGQLPATYRITVTAD